MAVMGGDIAIEPTQALLACVHRAAGQAAWLRLKVESLSDDEIVCVARTGAGGTYVGADGARST